ncbi:MAG: flagellar basal-body rod protein FlgF [Candidatus Competibacteraceae bacterium]|nr:flagellar basal-body rod protein FlgF [Candidatus Competibacteraceae bacterium]
MDRMLYVAMTGARQTLQAQAVNAHNLANVNTAGFRQDLGAFRSMPVMGEGLPSRVFAMGERAGVDFTPGPVTSTARELDVAVDGEGWIAIQAPDGGEAYTRAGDLRISAAGLLTTGAGHPVLGERGPIALPPAAKLEIGSDGTLSILPPGEGAENMAQVDRIRLVNPDPQKLYKDSGGLIRLNANEPPPPPQAGIRLVSGALEGSNVSSVTALVEMIDLARQFELQINTMRQVDENGQRSDQLMRME